MTLTSKNICLKYNITHFCTLDLSKQNPFKVIMKKSILIGCLYFLGISATFAQHNIIPVPVSFEPKNGTFILDANTSVNVIGNNDDVKRIAKLFTSIFKIQGKPLEVKTLTSTRGIRRAVFFSLNIVPNNAIGNEGYTIDITPADINVRANSPAGLFYAVQTLRQLAPYSVEDHALKHVNYAIKSCKITDTPRFAWRGIMLDVSRNFFTKEEVKDFIDLIARYKFNTFHFHLTDDNGWRIEIKSLPKLTSVGAWRVHRDGHFGDREEPKDGEPTPDGGFYTHDDIREIVKFASERHITIVPEIDVPGHCMAALAAYPELSTRKEPKKVNPGAEFIDWNYKGKFKAMIENTLNPCDEKVYEFLDKVFTEVAMLFPNKYIHMGGDECYHGFWEDDAACQKFMKENKIKDGHELQSYFVKRCEKIVMSKGKSLMGWDEILEGGLAPNAAVMSWQGMAGGIEAAKQKHDVVMSPTTFAYLDYTQGDHTIETPIYNDLSFKKSYAFEPLPDGVEAKYILGGQANIWTEQIQNVRHLEYMTFPRAFATAESVWSPKEKKNWDDFVRRTEDHFKRFDAAKMQICKAVYDPIVTTKKEGQKLICTINNDVAGTEVYYTINDSFPDEFAIKYTQSFEIPKGNVKLRAISYRNGKPIGRMLQIHRAELEKRATK